MYVLNLQMRSNKFHFGVQRVVVSCAAMPALFLSSRFVLGPVFLRRATERSAEMHRRGRKREPAPDNDVSEREDMLDIRRYNRGRSEMCTRLAPPHPPLLRSEGKHLKLQTLHIDSRQLGSSAASVHVELCAALIPRCDAARLVCVRFLCL